jgi:hypothetical protein
VLSGTCLLVFPELLWFIDKLMSICSESECEHLLGKRGNRHPKGSPIRRATLTPIISN